MPRVLNLVVCEFQGNWVGLLRRHLDRSGVRMVVSRAEERSALERELSRLTGTCVAIQVDAEQPVDTLEWLQRVTNSYPGVFVLVLAPPRMPTWPFFEAGASFVVSHALQAPDAVRVIRRFLDQRPPNAETTETIWSTLPWS